ncbi:cytochrome P450 [Heliocybe sulcata]|uniref:Cytochrome P450 n=1 Tax=Heliocybe sulcata TaxID=5364 RepID=A0A5C3NGP9_9AGAM|nr:cytochrome P450 [Heliocybe sulcata]
MKAILSCANTRHFIAFASGMMRLVQRQRVEKYRSHSQLSYIILCRRPTRGDIWLLYETGGAFCLLFLLRTVAQENLRTALQYVVVFMTTQVFALCFTAVVYRASPFHPLAKFPGPFLNKITSLKIALTVASGRRYSIIEKLHKKYGPFLRTGPNTISINLHQAVGPIYASSSAWNKSAAYSLGQLPGAGLFFIRDREAHNFRKRHYWAGAFTSNALSDNYFMLNCRTNFLLDALARRSQGLRGVVDVSTALQHWSHDVTGEFIFGDAYSKNLLRDGDRRGEVAVAIFEMEVFEVLGEVPSLFDVLWYLPLTRIFRAMDVSAERLLALRRSQASQKRNLAYYLLKGGGNSIPSLSDVDLRQETIVAVQAGTNGISTALTFALYYLTRNPKKCEILRDELQLAFPDADPDGSLDPQILGTLPYLNAVVEESLRLGAPLGSFPRVTGKGGAMIAGTYIPEGTIVGVPAWAQNVSEDNFSPSPTSFLPERWLRNEDTPDMCTRSSAMMTFSHGPFGCIGKPLAYQEMRIVISKIVLAYSFSFPVEFNTEIFEDGVRNLRATSFSMPLLLELDRLR